MLASFKHALGDVDYAVYFPVKNKKPNPFKCAFDTGDYDPKQPFKWKQADKVRCQLD